MSELSFKPKQITKKLVLELPERAQDIITRRYGLGEDTEPMTLESIGNIYGITRERVRQIENHSLSKMRESETMKEIDDAILELKNKIHSLGSVVSEEDLLDRLTSKKDERNHIYLLLVLGAPFEREKETEHASHRWHIDKTIERAVHDALERLHNELDEEDLVSEKEIIERFRAHLDEVTDGVPEEHKKDENIIMRWLKMSKGVGKNPLGEWGKADSPNVRLKGIRDYAYLVIRSHGSPMHFTEVTKKIRELFGKDAHTATTHNELIKDGRFVLVGRGLYALKEWGYMEGVVRDVIAKILKEAGPLTKDEIIDRVLKERYVKPNTVVVNLQDDMFAKNKDGKYTLVK